MLEKVKEILAQELQINPDDVTMDAELSKDLNINSIELYDMLARFEEKFDITISDEDANKFSTVKDVVEFLEKTSK